MLKKIILLSLLLFFITGCEEGKTMVDKTVVKELDIDRYLGKWYEIARYDHIFERGLVGVTATYSWREDGKIKVINSGFKGALNGPEAGVIGKAKIPNPEEPGKLKVSFFAFFYADYLVLDLDPEYQWAVVGSSSDDYLWILSRAPQMDQTLYNDLISKITMRGYDSNKLIRVEQKNATTTLSQSNK